MPENCGKRQIGEKGRYQQQGWVQIPVGPWKEDISWERMMRIVQTLLLAVTLMQGFAMQVQAQDASGAIAVMDAGDERNTLQTDADVVKNGETAHSDAQGAHADAVNMLTGNATPLGESPGVVLQNGLDLGCASAAAAAGPGVVGELAANAAGCIAEQMTAENTAEYNNSQALSRAAIYDEAELDGARIAASGSSTSYGAAQATAQAGVAQGNLQDLAVNEKIEEMRTEQWRRNRSNSARTALSNTESELIDSDAVGY